LRAILNLQQDKDIAYWGIDFGANEAKAAQLGVKLLRKPVRWRVGSGVGSEVGRV
jgi:hypothetical protein